jgi:GT2 family glycosyltransferase
MHFTDIIPTKNRLHDLEKEITTITSQTRKPEQFVLVDQSADRIVRDLEFKYSRPMPEGIEDVVKAMR